MDPGQMLVPLDTAGVGSTVRPKPVQDGRWGSIRWVLSAPVLPTVQNYAVVDVTAAQGVKPGDEFLVFRPRDTRGNAGSPALPEVAIGRAQAVRVTPFGTTVIFTSQVQPGIDIGSVVRVTARMP
jgi:hypothetical protein